MADPTAICAHCGAQAGQSHDAACPYGEIERLKSQLASGAGGKAQPLASVVALPGVPDPIAVQLRSQWGEEAQRLEKLGYTVVVRAPKRMEWRAFMTANIDPNKRPTTLEQLLRDCALWCTGAASLDRAEVSNAIDAMLDKRPGLCETFAGEITSMAGLSGGVDSRKNV